MLPNFSYFGPDRLMKPFVIFRRRHPGLCRWHGPARMSAGGCFYARNGCEPQQTGETAEHFRDTPRRASDRGPGYHCRHCAQSAHRGEVSGPVHGGLRGGQPATQMGTLGGNLCQKPRCWYYRGDFNCLRKGGLTCYAAEGENQFHCIFGSDDQCFIVHPSDTAPALAALNAKVHIAGPEGERYVPADLSCPSRRGCAA